MCNLALSIRRQPAPHSEYHPSQNTEYQTYHNKEKNPIPQNNKVWDSKAKPISVKSEYTLEPTPVKSEYAFHNEIDEEAVEEVHNNYNYDKLNKDKKTEDKKVRCSTNMPNVSNKK